MYLDELSMSEFRKKVKRKNLVAILPIGAVEAHGPHIPLCTDSIQPEYIAEKIAKKLNAIIAPPIRYGNCQSTKNYPGTISIQPDTLRAVVRDILTELVRNGVKNIVVLSGHAGSVHMAALRQAARDVVDVHDVKLMVLSDYDIAYELRGREVPGDDGHAGTIETSRVMAIKPSLVKNRGRKGAVHIPKFRVLRNPEKYWENATDGDPRKASASLGRRVNDYIVLKLAAYIREMLAQPG
jgi:creatinine amidohydrolase